MSLRRVVAWFLLTILAGATLMACDPPDEDGPSHEEELNELALAIKADHPEHYECLEYPSDDELQPTDLIPTANVVGVISYQDGTYQVQADERIRIERTVEEDTVDFRWTYAADVIHFAVYEYYRSLESDPYRWGQLPRFTNEDDSYYLSAPTSTEYPSTLVVIATDTGTCEPSTLTLPDEFNWETLGLQGILQPSV